MIHEVAEVHLSGLNFKIDKLCHIYLIFVQICRKSSPTGIIQPAQYGRLTNNAKITRNKPDRAANLECNIITAFP